MKQRWLYKSTVIVLVLSLFLSFSCSSYYASRILNNPATATSSLFNLPNSHIIGGRRLVVGADENYTLTRKQAIVNFIKALQLKDGAFVDTLVSPEEEEGTLQAYNAINTLSILNEVGAVDRSKLIEFIAKRQMSDGGFKGGMVLQHEVETITDAETVAYLLRQLNAFDVINKTALLEWIMGCYHPEDGRFAGRPKSASPEEYQGGYWVFHTVMGILALYWMNELDKIDVGRTIDYIMSCYQKDGGFSVDPYTNESSVDDTRWCLYTLYLLNALNRINKELTINFIMEYYNESSQTFVGPGPLLTSSAEWVVPLGWVGGLDRINTTKIVEVVLSCQSPLHGGFVTAPEDILKEDIQNGESIGATVMAVKVLSTLGALDMLNENFTITYNPAWHGEPYVPHSSNENTNPGPSPKDTENFVRNVVIAFLLFLSPWIIPSIIRRRKKSKRRKVKYNRARIKRRR